VDDEPAVALGLVQGHFGGGDHPGHRGGKREEGGGGGTEKVAALRNRFAPSRAFRFFFPHTFERGSQKNVSLFSSLGGGVVKGVIPWLAVSFIGSQ